MAHPFKLKELAILKSFRQHSSWAFYHPFDVLLEALALSLLSSVLGASTGVLIAARSATVRQAQQILSIGTLLLIFGGIFALRALPANFVSSLSYSQFLLLAIALIVVLDAILRDCRW